MSHESLPPTAESASPPKRWQFRLWHLFALMTYIAIVIAVARRWGIETLPVTIGLGIAWLSYSGALWFLQRGKLQLASGYILWSISFLLGLTAMPLNRATLLSMHIALVVQLVIQWTIGWRI